MKKRTQNRSISLVAALLLFTVFAAGILSVLLAGAGIYRRVTARDHLRFDSRSAIRYVATKVRQAPTPSALELGSFGGGDALLLKETADGAAYVTRVYCHDGWLMELFTAAEGDFAPEDGERLLPVRQMQLHLEHGLLTVDILDSGGQKSSLSLSLYSSKEAGHEE